MRRITIAIALAAALVLSAVGIGYALNYTGTYISEDNTIETDRYLIEVCDGHNAPLEDGIQFTSPRYHVHGEGTERLLHIDGAGSNEMNGYTLHVDCPGDSLMVSCMVSFKDPRSWAIVESIRVDIGGADMGDSTKWISMAGGVSSHPVQVSKGYHPLTVQIFYRQTDISLLGTEDIGFVDLSGTKLIFVAAEDAPLNAYALSYGGDGFSVHLESVSGPVHIPGSSVTAGTQVYVVPDEGKAVTVTGISGEQEGDVYTFAMPGSAVALSVEATDI